MTDGTPFSAFIDAKLIPTEMKLWKGPPTAITINSQIKTYMLKYLMLLTIVIEVHCIVF